MALKKPPIMSLGDFDDSTNILIYGDSGVGKTVELGTAKNALFLQIDPSGTVSAKMQGSDADVWPCPNWEEIEEARLWLLQGGYSKYDWVMVDSLTIAQDHLWDYIMRNVKEKYPHRHRFKPDQGEYFENYLTIKHMAKSFVDLPVNVAFTALPQIIVDKNGEERLLPAIIGQNGTIAHQIMGLMTSIGYMEEIKFKGGKTGRRIWWENHGQALGRDKYGVLGPHTTNLGMPEIIARINGSGKKATPRRAEGTAGKVTRPNRSSVVRPQRRSNSGT